MCVRTDITGHNLQRVAIELLTYVIDIQRDLIAYYSFIKEKKMVLFQFDCVDGR